MPESQPRERQINSLGSGVIIDGAEGYVVTNHHVIENADEINVRLHDGRSFVAEVIGTDPEADIAVIQIPSSDLRGIDIGDSEGLRVGDFVVAHWQPFRSWADGDFRHRQRQGGAAASALKGMRISSKPMPPSIKGILAAHWSIFTANWLVSILLS